MAVVAVLALGGCGGDEPPRDAAPSPADVTKLAREYVDAFNRRDGERICELYHPNLHEWLERTFVLAAQHEYGCAKTVESYIGHVEDNPQTEWLRASIVTLGRVEVTGERASVALTVRHTYAEKPPRKPEADVLHFVSHDGEWRLAKPGRVFLRALNAYNDPEGTLDPPADPDLLGRPATLPAPAFACRGTAQELSDRRGDVAWYDDRARADRPTDAPWLDIRRATVRRRGRAACLVIELAAPPRPASSYHWAFEESLPGPHPGTFRPRRVGLRIDGSGQAHALGNAVLMGATSAPMAPPRFGARGNELHLELGSPTRPRWMGWHVLARSLQDDEPILTDPVRGNDRVPEQ